jgi:hypothetical protein
MSNLGNLTERITIRLDKNFCNQLKTISDSHLLSESALCRIILMRNLNDYSRNRGFL